MKQETIEVRCDDTDLFCAAMVADDPRGIAVLLHGIPAAEPDPDDPGYEGFARSVAERGWTALWADMRGVRRSGGYFSIEGWVRDAAAIVEAARGLGHGFLALVGSSAGGVVSAEIVRRGTEVDALALLAAPAAWMSFAADPPAGVRRITEEAGMPLAPDVIADPTSWAAEFDAITAADAIASVKVPTLIVHGMADDIVPVEHAQLIAEHAPDAEVRILEGAGHQLRTDPEAVDVLTGWLERVSR